MRMPPASAQPTMSVSSVAQIAGRGHDVAHEHQLVLPKTPSYRRDVLRRPDKLALAFSTGSRGGRPA
jgi:hypothetical protein